MYLSPLRRPLIAAALLMIFWSTSAMASATVSVNPTGDLSYTIDGMGMDGVAGIQLDITYDANSLNTPKVTPGSLVAGAMLSANTSRTGLIKIAIISTRPFSGSGQIASITFAAKTGSGGIISFTTNLIDSNSASISAIPVNQPNESIAPATILTPGIPFSQTQQPPQTGLPAATTTSAFPGSVTMPAELQQRVDAQPEPSTTDPAFTGEPVPEAAVITEQSLPSSAPAADAKVEDTPQYLVYNGILDRFKQYNGSKSLSAMVMLFNKKTAQTIYQEPAILLSDGHNRAILTIDIPSRITTSPNFAANGGRMVTFNQDKQSKGRWTVVVQPEAGAVKTTLTIISGAEEFEYPLTVAPPAKTALSLDEIGWSRFLEEVGTTTAPLHDLNADGVRDYIDEFIFVANHLAGKSTPIKPAVPSSKSGQ